MTVIITGISSGIGYALAQYYLKQQVQVIGIGRKNNINHEKLTFFERDLAITTDFSFLEEIIHSSEELMLINNAGVIGNIERISEQKQSDISETIQINTIAPMLLCQYVLQQFNIQKLLTIVNISSGAGRRAIPSWASYCASKAALDLFSQTIYLEEKERGRAIRVYSVAPGVVDTPMQEKIRNAKSSTFSSLNSFIELKDKNELTNVDTLILKFEKLFSKEYSGEVIYSLREVSV